MASPLNVGATPSFIELQQAWSHMETFVGLTEREREAMLRSVPVIAAAVPELLDAIYEHLVSFDETRKILTRSRGPELQRYLEDRKDHLAEWFVMILGEPDRKRMIQFLRGVALVHTARTGDPTRIVPPRYMLGLTGFLQARVTMVLVGAMPDRIDEAVTAALGWSRFLIVQLDLFLNVMVPGWSGA